ncbi:MAG: B12-binding domain-containing radical SAM protein [Candidatus Krumholzibacteriota bacterium]|nr:B12-binding domain-containing radical SAM protein [Candidatus Krumholzibacteriota bacterium]
MRLLMINPSNPYVSMVKIKESRWNRYRVWKPLSLMVLAGMTPPEWEITVIDENFGIPDYQSMPRPDLVAVTAFTSQANRAYAVASYFEKAGVPVVIGGIHVTMCLEEAMEQVNSVVTGEAESIWGEVLEDAKEGRLKRRYDGGLAAPKDIPVADHGIFDSGYAFGSIQTTRGCPLNCSFCSVSAFNGVHYRLRPVDDVVREFGKIKEKRVLVVDDNIIGTRPEHIARAKELFRAMIDAGLKKEWIAQTTINFADDEELLDLAARAGCSGVFIGFESVKPEGLIEVGKKFNLLNNRDFHESVKRIHRHNILVVGSFIIGLNVDEPGIGRYVADSASRYGVDSISALFLTPLPGTRLWDEMESEGRIVLDNFPEDWKYYTLTFPVARYKNFSLDSILREMEVCTRTFYSLPRIFLRVWDNVWHRRKPWISIMGNLSYRGNILLSRKLYGEYVDDVSRRFS